MFYSMSAFSYEHTTTLFFKKSFLDARVGEADNASPDPDDQYPPPMAIRTDEDTDASSLPLDPI